ncbi:MAG: CoA-binding protein [Nanoarchaeota archaeon]|nr:CoA-binding protein [Nanoarchaeota archaeon]
MKDLNLLFNPKSIAVIGASRDEKSVGHGILVNLLKGGMFATRHNEPFKGNVYPINPNADVILGLKCHKSIIEIKDKIDMAVIAVKAQLVPSVLKECARKQVKAVIVISSGFAEFSDEGKQLQKEITDIAKKEGIILLGPNCLGLVNTYASLNASFAPAMPPKGEIGFISQSGALADSIIDWALWKNYGFSKLVSYGNAAGIGITQLVEHMSNDKETKAIALYAESIPDGRKFMAAAKKSKKPIVVLKAGRAEKGMNAAKSHTGNLAGSYDVYKAAFRQSNVHITDNVDELFEAAQVMAYQPRLKGNSIAIVTNGGGCGVITADSCAEHGMNLAVLDEKTLSALDKSGKMHPAYSRSNPLDIVGDALPDRYDAALNAVLQQKDVHGLIMIQTLQTMTDPVENARVILNARKKFPDKPIIAVFMGGKFTRMGKLFLESNKVPVYAYPAKAVLAMKALLHKR